MWSESIKKTVLTTTTSKSQGHRLTELSAYGLLHEGGKPTSGNTPRAIMDTYSYSNQMTQCNRKL